MTNRTEHDPLAELSALGVAVWLDDLSRELLAGGELAFLIADRHVVGVTTNPTIFASALSKGDRYNGQLRDLAERGADVGRQLAPHAAASALRSARLSVAIT